jgi:hypothetical protein
MIKKLPFCEDRLRDHAVNALGAVDHLGDVIVDRDARNHVGLLARELGKTFGNEKDGFAHGDLHRFFRGHVSKPLIFRRRAEDGEQRFWRATLDEDENYAYAIALWATPWPVSP